MGVKCFRSATSHPHPHSFPLKRGKEASRCALRAHFVYMAITTASPISFVPTFLVPSV